MKYRFQLFMLILLVINTFTSSAQKVLEGGKIKEKNFIETIPFNFDYGMPLIQVEITGQRYTFLFDTGAPTVISPELAEKFNLKSNEQAKISDSQGNNSSQEFVSIPQLKIGVLNFENIGAAIVDLKKVFEFKCVNFDGIIGANLMEKAIWQIDYQEKIITVADRLKAFDISADAKVISFIPKKVQQTPLVPVKIGEKITYQTFDTGSSGGFVFNIKSYENELQNLKKIEAIGSLGAGITSTSKTNTIMYYKIPIVVIGEITLTNQVYQASETTSQTIGNLFLKNYKVVMDWKTQKIYLTKVTDYTETTLSSFGISIRYADHKAIINKLFKNSAAEKAGLMLQDKVTSINGKSLVSLPDEEACGYLIKSPLSGQDSIKITIQRDGKTLSVELQKETFID